MGDWEGNTSEHVDLGDETNNVEIECNDDERHRVEETQGDDDRHGEEQTGGDHEIHDEEEREGDDESDSQDIWGCRDREEAANVEEEDAEELEVLDNDYFESASDTDDEGSRFMKRQLKQIRCWELYFELIMTKHYKGGGSTRQSWNNINAD
ncbi:hypothetical protein Tco_1421904 [Tanacetum coccineum]